MVVGKQMNTVTVMVVCVWKDHLQECKSLCPARGGRGVDPHSPPNQWTYTTVIVLIYRYNQPPVWSPPSPQPSMEPSPFPSCASTQPFSPLLIPSITWTTRPPRLLFSWLTCNIYLFIVYMSIYMDVILYFNSVQM